MAGWGYAFSLSKQQVAEAEPPGTVRLVEHGLHRTQSGRDQQEDHIHLIPEPSQSAADPLNWPAWRKTAVLLTMSLYSGCANFASAAVAPALPILAFQLLPPKQFSELSHLVAVNVLLIGTSNIFWVPLANTFGRRPVLIVALLLSVLTSMWCGLAQTFGSLLAARAIQGIGFGPCDAVAPDVVGEIYFVHERGRAIAIYTLFLAGGSFVGGVAGSYIAGTLGYRYIFWISTAMLGFVFLLELFLVPETMFDRQAQLVAEHHPSVVGDGSVSDEKGDVTMIERAVPTDSKITFARSMKIGLWRGDLVKHFLDPWRSLAFPGTWVVMIHYGGLLGGLVSIATVGPQFLAMPPYLWGNNVGLLGLGPVVGGFLGFGATYLSADSLLTRKAKHESHGLAEPESRLPAMFPALILATCGIWTFGFCAANPSQHAWVGMIIGYGMVGFGITQIPSIGFSYLIDSYYAISADCFVMTTIARAVVSFAWTFFTAQWIASAGAALPFGIYGMLMGVFALFTLPLWLYGKRLRIATAGFLPKHENH
ncbi:hypothetical protein BAUCODRAFT_144936 [Baudoinia panamericana UAMH 10762]|uniref:Major facilitator superfamily (MFS) profile domain-containing protein n=1 Tax=Baudoinia panamericana (strain UAMH 10762) TaxID=717646 RepID=M2NJG2_BAUPA|nr:uncharacterized protein BAUCODRAFT_144936 [Baudoinia panamericana UAMH 10762]EMC99524.1 hypothetical protein BAUCODRAFT_144936 [Baudoinia panamericana UAMH 10762]